MVLGGHVQSSIYCRPVNVLEMSSDKLYALGDQLSLLFRNDTKVFNSRILL